MREQVTAPIHPAIRATLGAFQCSLERPLLEDRNPKLPSPSPPSSNRNRRGQGGGEGGGASVFASDRQAQKEGGFLFTSLAKREGYEVCFAFMRKFCALHSDQKRHIPQGVESRELALSSVHLRNGFHPAFFLRPPFFPFSPLAICLPTLREAKEEGSSLSASLSFFSPPPSAQVILLSPFLPFLHGGWLSSLRVSPRHCESGEDAFGLATHLETEYFRTVLHSLSGKSPSALRPSLLVLLLLFHVSPVSRSLRLPHFFSRDSSPSLSSVLRAFSSRFLFLCVFFSQYPSPSLFCLRQRRTFPPFSPPRL